MDLTTVIIGGLITFRVSKILSKETGPAAVFARLRAYLAKKQQKVGGWFDMISCTSCVSVFVGALTSLAFAGGVLEFLGYTFAFSAVSLLLEAPVWYRTK